MFFAKPRLSAAVINCADCPASLISGSLAFVTVYPPPHLSLSLSIHASIHPSIHPSVHLLPPSFSPFRSNHLSLSLSLSLAARERHPSPLLTPPRPFVCACFDRLSSPLPPPVFPISNGRAVRAPRNWPANEPFRVKSCTGVVYRVVVLNFCQTCGGVSGWNDRSGEGRDVYFFFLFFL